MTEKLEICFSIGLVHMISDNISISNALSATKLCPEDPCGLLDRLFI